MKIDKSKLLGLLSKEERETYWKAIEEVKKELKSTDKESVDFGAEMNLHLLSMEIILDSYVLNITERAASGEFNAAQVSLMFIHMFGILDGMSTGLQEKIVDIAAEMTGADDVGGSA